MWYEATRITITAYQVSKDIAAYMASLEEE